MSNERYEINGKKFRVCDLVKTSNESEKEKLMLLFDKKFSTVLTCMKFDQALSKETEDLHYLQHEMCKLIEEAYTVCKTEIRQNAYYKLNNCELHLQKIRKEIKDVQEKRCVSREIIEIACLKLALLCDLSRGVEIFLPSSDDGGSAGSQNKLKTLLTLPLEDVESFKKTMGAVGVSSTHNDFWRHKTILPIFSRNGSVGINTLLFALFHKYHPIGGNAKPHPVHAGAWIDESFQSMQHDYGHVLVRIFETFEEDPETFEKYMTLYFKLFEQKNSNLIDDETLMKDLLMLHFLAYENAYSPNNSRGDDVEDYIKEGTVLISEIGVNWRYFPEQGFNTFLTKMLVKEYIDYLKPLELLGYKFNNIPGAKWGCAAELREALTQLLNEFSKRHPEIEIKARKPKIQPAPTSGEPQMIYFENFLDNNIYYCDAEPLATSSLETLETDMMRYFNLSEENKVIFVRDKILKSIQEVIDLKDKTNKAHPIYVVSVHPHQLSSNPNTFYSSSQQAEAQNNNHVTIMQQNSSNTMQFSSQLSQGLVTYGHFSQNNFQQSSFSMSPQIIHLKVLDLRDSNQEHRNKPSALTIDIDLIKSKTSSDLNMDDIRNHILSNGNYKDVELTFIFKGKKLELVQDILSNINQPIILTINDIEEPLLNNSL